MNSYYVNFSSGSNSNNGTSSGTAWATIAYAASNLTLGTADTCTSADGKFTETGVGACVHVASGTFTGNIVTTRSGTSSARIVWVSDTKWAAKLVGVSGGQVWNCGCAYNDIIGFDVSGDANQGIIFGNTLGSLNSTARDNYVHDLAGPDVFNDSCNNGTAGLNMGASDDIQFIGNIVVRIGVATASQPHICGQGIYLSGKNGVAQNNIIGALNHAAGTSGGSGIDTYHRDYALHIINNFIFNANVGTDVYQGGSDTIGTLDYVVVANNVFYNVSAPINEGGTLGTHLVYDHNLINNCGSSIIHSGTPITNTVTAAPTFVNYQSNGTGDYHSASSSSPQVDAGLGTNPSICSGNTTSPICLPAIDFDGLSRGSQFDIGAYEFQATSATSAPAAPAGLTATVQ